MAKPKYVHDTVVHNFNAAKQVVPFVLSLVKPKTVIDVGCGTGTWLKIFQDHGIAITGVEGAHLKKDMLLIDEKHVITADLESKLEIDSQFDLVVSLEVAEHLKPEAAETFVNTLTSLGNVILFSAAIPRQGGQNHINEQWPTYWQKLFNNRGYYFCDTLRKKFWDDAKVEPFYKQNMFLVCHESLSNRFEKTDTILNIVHPELLLKFRKKAFKPVVAYKP